MNNRTERISSRWSHLFTARQDWLSKRKSAEAQHRDGGGWGNRVTGGRR